MDESGTHHVRTVLESRRVWLQHAATGSETVREQALRDLEDAGRSEERVRQDYFGRYPIELLQNAHDACVDASVRGWAWIAVTRTALLVGNQGAPFDAGRIESLTRLGASTKHPGDHRNRTIGYKGIGFSAVFEITDSPQIIGRNPRLNFGFDRTRALREVEAILGRVPAAVSARAFPFELKADDWGPDSSVVEAMLDAGAVTVVRCPFRDGTDPEAVGAEIGSQLVPEVLLFMEALKGLNVDVLGERTSTLREAGPRIGTGTRIDLRSARHSRSWVVARRAVEAPAAAIAALKDAMWTDVRMLDCAVALPWRDDGPDPDRDPATVHVYFPTAEHHGRPFLVHGDFYVTSNRRHIEIEGPGGDVSRAVALGAAELLAELVASLRDHGGRLLGCLALQANAGGFGEVLTQCLVDAFRSAPILSDAHAQSPIAPVVASRIPALDEPSSRAILAACLPGLTLVDPEVDHGPAAAFLDELGVPLADDVTVAESLDPSRTQLGYDDVLGALADWRLGAVPRTTAGPIMQALAKRPIVQDHEGNWCTPTGVRRLGQRIGVMPSWLRRPTLREPTRASAHRFVESLGVRGTDLGALMGEVASRYAQGPALEHEDARQTLEFVLASWESDRSTVEERLKRAAQDVLVPAKAVGQSGTEWRSAGAVYFGTPWTADTLVEDVYGHFGNHEFLALGPGESFGDHVPDRAFFDFLGIAAAPRAARRSVRDNGDEVRLLKNDPRFIPLACGNDRHRSLKHVYSISVLDRLERLVLHAPEDPRPLVRLLEAVGDESDADTLIECTHPYHQNRAPSSRVLSYRRAVVNSQPWVEVTGDALARDRLPPWRVWSGLGESRTQLCLPRPLKAVGDPQQLGFMNADHPTEIALSTALQDLAQRFERLADAPDDIITTADWLLQELDRALRRDGADVPRSASGMRFPAWLGSSRSWQSVPVVPDVPGLERLPALPVLPSGRWLGLSKAFRLEAASHVVSPHVVVDQRLNGYARLNDDLRVELVAGLRAQGVPLSTAANRVLNLSESVLEPLELEVSYAGDDARVPVLHFLDVVRDRAGRIRRAELFRSPARSFEEPVISQDLAQYLESSETVVYQLLNQPTKWLRLWKVGEGEIEEAREALFSARHSHVESQVKVTESGHRSTSSPLATAPVPANANSGTRAAQSEKSSHPQGSDGGNAEPSLRDGARGRMPWGREQLARPPGATRSAASQARPRRLVSYAEVVPEATDVPDPSRREAAEAIDRAGIDAVVAFEQAFGRTPEVQDHGNPGFDIRSGEGDGAFRYIEVKSMRDRWSMGAVALTRRQVEENRARGEGFWLYVVERALDPANRVVHTIHNPVEQIDRLAFGDDWIIAVTDE